MLRKHYDDASHTVLIEISGVALKLVIQVGHGQFEVTRWQDFPSN